MPRFKPGHVILDVQGYELDVLEREVLRHPQVGGVILFARNYHDPAQLAALTAHIRQLNPSLLIAVDQEGGRVQRFKTGFTRLPPMGLLGDIYATTPASVLALAKDLGWLMASEVLQAGVDLSFAPVLDVNTGTSGVIGDRAFGATPEQVSILASSFITGMAEVGMQATGKHFPGHGSVAEDSHVELPMDARSFDEISRWDMQPFMQLKDQLAGVMPAHIIFSEVDAQPVGFSRIWLDQILRQQLGFTGVVVSDDLSMAGAAFAGGHADRARSALEAGCDAVLVCNNPVAAHSVIEFLEQGGLNSNHKLTALMPQRQASAPPLAKQERWQQLQRTLAALSAF